MLAERESTVEQYLKQRTIALGGEVRKVKWTGRSNAPDRLVMLGGWHCYVELKRKGKQPTDAQHREHIRMTNAGMRVYWANSKEMVDYILSKRGRLCREI